MDSRGDFNDIRCPKKKSGGRFRSESSCKGFLDFIRDMNMVEVEYQGRKWTWANNWQDERFIEAKLDRFFRALPWKIENESAIVLHVEKQASDHCLILLDTWPSKQKHKRRFYFYKRWVGSVVSKRL